MSFCRGQLVDGRAEWFGNRIKSIHDPIHQVFISIRSLSGYGEASLKELRSTYSIPSVGFVSLGCPKALVDSERILTRLRVEGYGVVGDYSEADLVVINTCGFIEAAQEESLQAISEALDRNGRVIVTGCLGGRTELIEHQFGNQLLAVTGPHEDEAVMRAILRYLPPPDHHPLTELVPKSGIKLTPRHYAYLKVSEGCNHSCSFCIIPQLRGSLVSRAVGDVMGEAERLVADGVRELLVIAQDTSAYGLDMKFRTGFWNGRPIKSNFFSLAQALSGLGAWVRLHYVYPYPHVDEVIGLMTDGHVLPYLDVPMQHASPSILKAMRRPAAGEVMLERIDRWRELCPDLVIRSTFIIGFPGESEEDFEQLLDFINEAELDRVGCFAYSPVDGAPANAMAGAVPEDEKLRRFDEFMRLQAEISEARLARFAGRQLTVLVDEVLEDGLVARSYADSPEVDGVVHVRGANAETRPGDFIEVRIEGNDAYDLFAVGQSSEVK